MCLNRHLANAAGPDIPQISFSCSFDARQSSAVYLTFYAYAILSHIITKYHKRIVHCQVKMWYTLEKDRREDSIRNINSSLT